MHQSVIAFDPSASLTPIKRDAYPTLLVGTRVGANARARGMPAPAAPRTMRGVVAGWSSYVVAASIAVALIVAWAGLCAV